MNKKCKVVFLNFLFLHSLVLPLYGGYFNNFTTLWYTSMVNFNKQENIKLWFMAFLGVFGLGLYVYKFGTKKIKKSTKNVENQASLYDDVKDILLSHLKEPTTFIKRITEKLPDLKKYVSESRVDIEKVFFQQSGYEHGQVAGLFNLFTAEEDIVIKLIQSNTIDFIELILNLGRSYQVYFSDTLLENLTQEMIYLLFKFGLKVKEEETIDKKFKDYHVIKQYIDQIYTIIKHAESDFDTKQKKLTEMLEVSKKNQQEKKYFDLALQNVALQELDYQNSNNFSKFKSESISQSKSSRLIIKKEGPKKWPRQSYLTLLLPCMKNFYLPYRSIEFSHATSLCDLIRSPEKIQFSSLIAPAIFYREIKRTGESKGYTLITNFADEKLQQLEHAKLQSINNAKLLKNI